MNILKRSLLVVICIVHIAHSQDVRLSGTTPLTWPEAGMPERLMDGAHRFVERKIADAALNRHQYWPASDAGADAWKKAVNDNREELQRIIGAVDKRSPSRLEYFSTTIERIVAYEGDGFRVTQVR